MQTPRYTAYKILPYEVSFFLAKFVFRLYLIVPISNNMTRYIIVFQCFLFLIINHIKGQDTNKVYTSIYEALQTPAAVRKLDLHNQGLTELPAQFNKLTNLRELNLSLNLFHEFPLVVCELQ